MEQVKESKELLKKAKRAVWLNRYFKRPIPKEYEALILAKKCCNERFMHRYVLENKLLESNEETFLKTYLKGQNKDDLQFVKTYVFIHGASKQGQILVVQSKNVDVITALINSYDSIASPDVCPETLTELVELKDPCLLEALSSAIAGCRKFEQI